MDVRTLKVGPERANCYIVSLESGGTAVIDPGGDAPVILTALSELSKLDLKYILLTHAHFDHLLATDEIKEQFPKADVVIGEADIELYHQVSEQGAFVGLLNLKNQTSEVIAVSDDDFLTFGDKVIKVIATPGHTKGSVCFLIEDLLFTGDTLFYHTVGRTDLPYSSEHDLKISLDKVLHLPTETYVLPGHGRTTHIGEERAFNGIQ